MARSPVQCVTQVAAFCSPEATRSVLPDERNQELTTHAYNERAVRPRAPRHPAALAMAMRAYTGRIVQQCGQGTEVVPLAWPSMAVGRGPLLRR